MPYDTGIYKPNDRKYNCDICGYTWRFSDIKRGVADGQRGYGVCPDCFDPVHPRERNPILRPKTKLEQI